MATTRRPTFAQIVCSDSAVQSAFLNHGPTQCWWRLILLLHGKPLEPSMSPAARTAKVAEGFRFYAMLYRSVAVLFLALSPALFAIHRMDQNEVSTYWPAASLLAAFYLWNASGLGFAGARIYETNEIRGTSALVGFMVMIVAFLSLFVAALSVMAHHAAWLGTMPNLVAAAALFVFGVGSYMIEIVYLATARQP